MVRRLYSVVPDSIVLFFSKVLPLKVSHFPHMLPFVPLGMKLHTNEAYGVIYENRAATATNFKFYASSKVAGHLT